MLPIGRRTRKKPRAVYVSVMRKSENMPEFEIRDDEHGVGKVLILKGTWSADISDYMLTEGIYALRLTDSCGFKGEDLSFLPSLTYLKSLELYCWDAKNIKLLEALPQLEVLGLQFRSLKTIDFSHFTKLRVALLTWVKGLESIFSLKNIEYINIQNYPHKNLKPIEHMKKLKRLYLTSRKLESLEGIENLDNLEELDLCNCRQLVSKAGIEKLYKLQKLEIEACNKLSA